MKIAIIGAGLAGVAAAWHLQNQLHAHITLFDPLGIAGGTSGIAAGLLHPYVGQTAKLNWLGKEGMAATCELLTVAGIPLLPTGFLRLCQDAKTEDHFKKCAEKNADAEWLQETSFGPSGILIHSALSVPVKSYLQGLWKACEKRGALFVEKQIESLDEVSSYDRVILATGPALNLHSLPLYPVKGQLLVIEWPKNTPPLKTPLGRSAYLLKDPEGSSYIAGATYEHLFMGEHPDVEVAKRELEPKITKMIPSLKEARVLEVRSGIRASTPDHLPLLKQLSTRCWALVGLGSKGLLYHALFAKELALRIAQIL